MKRFLTLILFSLVVFEFAYSQQADTIKYRSLSPYDFHLEYLRDDSAMLIDVREFFEYKKSRINSAVNIPSSDDLTTSADSIGKGKSLFIYCTTGYRSKRVSKFFTEHGFYKVYNLDGGISAWKKEDMPVDKKRKKKL